MLVGSKHFGSPPKTTKTIALEQFWPVFAAVALSARVRMDFPQHPALQHKITRVQTRASGETIVHLGEKIGLGRLADMGGWQKRWYPSTPDDATTSRLFRRILSDR